MVLEANIDVITSLRKFYAVLQNNRDFPSDLKKASREDIETFAANLDGIITELNHDVKRARVLVSQIGDRKELVGFLCLFFYPPSLLEQYSYLEQELTDNDRHCIISRGRQPKEQIN